MSKRAVLLALAVLAGCAERDNPYDPSNIPPKSPAEPKTDLWVPKPGGHVKVLMEDSAKKYGKLDSSYVGNLGYAISRMNPDDTLYIYGGGGEYPIAGAITFTNKGTLGHPIVILPFGGNVKYRLVPPKDMLADHCLKFENSHVKMVGISCVGGGKYGLMAGGGVFADGSLDLDSITLDKPGDGILVSKLLGPVRIHNLTILNANQDKIPVVFIENPLLDTSNIFW